MAIGSTLYSTGKSNVTNSIENQGTFTLKDGTISSEGEGFWNYGGTFYMEGGILETTGSGNWNALYIGNDSTFIMTGGIIRASGTGYGILRRSFCNGIVTLKGGTVSSKNLNG